MKKLLILTLVLSLKLYSDDSLVRTIESISYRSQQGNTIALIELSDTSVWKWIPDTYSENLLRKWEHGDEVIVKTINHPGFILQNLSKPLYSPTVSLTFNSYLIFPSIENYDEKNYSLNLSDGTQWNLVFDFNQRTLHHWSYGDRIIPVQEENGVFELINLDIPHENRTKIERSVQVNLTPQMFATIEEKNLPSLETHEEMLEPKEEDPL